MEFIDGWRQRKNDLFVDFSAKIAGHCEYWLGSDQTEVPKNIFIDQMLIDYAAFKPQRNQLYAELEAHSGKVEKGLGV